MRPPPSPAPGWPPPAAPAARAAVVAAARWQVKRAGLAVLAAAQRRGQRSGHHTAGTRGSGSAPLAKALPRVVAGRAHPLPGACPRASRGACNHGRAPEAGSLARHGPSKLHVCFLAVARLLLELQAPGSGLGMQDAECKRDARSQQSVMSGKRRRCRRRCQRCGQRVSTAPVCTCWHQRPSQQPGLAD